MQYPLMSEYVSAIRAASENLKELAHLVPVLDDHGEPYRSSGAFAVVFKMKDEQTGKCYALKCFLEEQEGRAEAYQMIADELDCVDSSYVTSVKYLEKEIFVDSSCEEDEFPVLLMDWVEGETMESYIVNNYQDEYAMGMLCYRFCKMAAWLRSQPFAHGDIKPDNIIVRPDGTLALVDYDGMFVPSMKGQKSPTIGTKDFSHPLRVIDDFDETIDDFALASIALSLKAISLKPSLLDEYGAADRLLFSVDDYRDLSKSKVFGALQELMNDEEFTTLLSMFLLANAKKNLAMCSFRLFLGKKPDDKIENLSTEVTKEELKNAITDEYGVKYSRDGKRLLKVRTFLVGTYIVRLNTKVICNYAFCPKDMKSNYLKSIDIPNSVITIGSRAFFKCELLCGIIIPDSVKRMNGNPFAGWNGELKVLTPMFIYDNGVLFNKEKTELIAFRWNTVSYVIPQSVTSIGDDAFYGCSSLASILIPNSVTSIGNFTFYGCESLLSIVIPDSVTSIGYSAFRGCKSLLSIVIPDSVTSIEESTFDGCESLSNIVISNRVTSIGKYAFDGCESLYSIVIPDSVTSIGAYAFRGCKSLSRIVIPDSVTSIGGFAFYGCESLSNIVISNRVTSIGTCAFDGCKSLSSIVIPDSVTSIGESAFYGCESLYSIVIPNSVTSIGDYVFFGCESLSRIVIPDIVTSIGNYAFCGCESLSRIVIPDSVTSIGDYAFDHCSSLSSIVISNCVVNIGDYAFGFCPSLDGIVIPNSVSSIGNSAFYYCDSLSSIVISDSVTSIGDSAFYGCSSLVSIVIPNSVTSIGEFAFYGCSSLSSIVIPDSVASIGDYAFYGCSSLSSVVVPDSVTSIGKRAFADCRSLTSLVVPKCLNAMRRNFL